jgi:hypothetical protein
MAEVAAHNVLVAMVQILSLVLSPQQVAAAVWALTTLAHEVPSLVALAAAVLATMMALRLVHLET